MRALLFAAALAAALPAVAGPVLSTPPPKAAAEPRRVGVYPLERLGPADPAYDRVQAYLKKNLQTFPQVEAFDLATPQRCKGDDLGCLVNVGKLAAADLVVHGSVERFNNGYAVRLQLIDVGRTTRKEVKRFINGGSADLVAAMELSACELVTTERCQGTLRIDGVPGAQVLVDARDVGTTPYEAPAAIGRVAVRVAKDGLSTEDRFVNVSFHQQTQLQVQQQNGRLVFGEDFDALPLPPELVLPPEDPKALPDVVAANDTPAPAAVKVSTAAKPAPTTAPAATPAPSTTSTRPPPPPPATATTSVQTLTATRADAPKAAGSSTLVAENPEATRRPESVAWLPTAFYASAGVGAAALLTGAVFGVMAELKAGEVNEKYDRHELSVADKPLYDSARSRAAVANVSYGIAGIGLAAAAVMYLVDPLVVGAGGDAAVYAGPTGVGAKGSF